MFMNDESDKHASAEIVQTLKTLFAGNKATVTAEDLADVYQHLIVMTETIVDLFKTTTPVEEEKLAAIDNLKKAINDQLDQLGASVTQLTNKYYDGAHGKQ
jgi:hypothetical protein